MRTPASRPIAMLVFCCMCVVTGSVLAEDEWICTTATDPWRVRPLPKLSDAGHTAPEIAVYPGEVRQEIDGFGGCFNELGWKALSGLGKPARDAVLAALFSDDGCGFTMARTPIGSSDFGLNYYSLDDTADDYELKHFSIDRDRNCLIPYIKSAMEFRPKLRLWASAWSPPAWMKENGKYNGGNIRQDQATLKSYATYLARYAEEYRKAGVNIYAVHVQNEPRITSNYPTCYWEGWQMRDFVRDHMGPVFRDRKLDAEIWLGTINDGNFNATVGTVLADPRAAAFISGMAFQYDGQHIIADAHRLYPNFRLMQSENECYSGKNSFADAENTFSLFRKYMNGGANAYFFWNMVLQPDGKSSWGWAQNAMVTVDAATGKVTYDPEYYFMKHVAHFIPPKSRMVMTTGPWGDKIAFVRPDGSIVLIVGNSSGKPLPVNIGVPGVDGKLISATLPSHSFNTFVISAPAR